MKEKTFNWTHKLDDVSETARAFERTATDQQRQSLIDAFGLLDCEQFSAAYQLTAMAGGKVALVGRFKVVGAQACVVTLEPVPFSLDEDLTVNFVPAKSLVAEDTEVEYEALALDDIEAYTGAEQNVGQVLFEHFGAALEPYPRVPRATLDDPLVISTDGDQTTHPFAELKKLKGNI